MNTRGNLTARAIAVVTLLLATACVFYPSLRSPSELLVGTQRNGNNDLTSVFLAVRLFPTFGEGAAYPAWNPYAMLGTPFLGNPQSAAWYPPNWLFLLWPGIAMATWLLVAHHLWAGLGVFLLCRKYGLRLESATVAGIVLLAAPFVVAQTGEGHFNQVCVSAWIPWAALAYERWRQGGRAGTLLVTASLTLAFLAGHVQEVWYLVLMLSAFMLTDTACNWRKENAEIHWTAFPARWCLVGLATAGLVAIELVPTILYSLHSVRSSGVAMAEVIGDLDIASVKQLVHPFLLGDVETFPFLWERLFYFGAAPLLLAGYGGWVARRVYPTRRFLVLWLISAAFAFGPGSFVFYLLYTYVPAIDMFRAPGRALFFTSFATAVLAGLGTERLLPARSSEGESVQPSRLPWLAPALLLVALAVALISRSDVQRWTAMLSLPSSTGAARSMVPWLAGLTIGSLLLWCAVRNSSTPRNWAFPILVTLIVAELAWFSNSILTTVAAPTHRDTHPAIEAIRNASAESGEPPRTLAQQYLLSDREAWQNHVSKVQAYEPVPLAQNVALIAPLTHDDPLAFFLGFESLDLSRVDPGVARLLGVRFAVVGPQQSIPPAWRLLKRGTVDLEFAARPGGRSTATYEVYENQEALPRAYVVGEVRRLDPNEPPEKQLRSVRPTREVLLREDVWSAEGRRASFRPAEISRFEPNEIHVQLESDGAGYLVLSEGYYPGWTATLDGQPVPILRANVGLRAVAVPMGSHQAVFRYRTAGLTWAGALSAITAILLLGMTWHLGWRDDDDGGTLAKAEPQRGRRDDSAASPALAQHDG